MTASYLIAEIFSREQGGAASNMRRLTPRQFTCLRDMIEAETASGKAGATVRRGDNGSLVWTPPGPDKYILTEDARGNKRTLTRLGNLGASGSGSLFSENDQRSCA